MYPGELIGFMMLIGIALVIFIVLAIILRKHKRVVAVIGGLLVVLLAGYYVTFPAQKENLHEKSLQTVQAYLAETYPGESFNIQPEAYEERNNVTQFEVSRAGIEPKYGVTLDVDDGEVTEVAWWAETGSLQQPDLWQTLYFTDYNYTLADEPRQIELLDTWIDGSKTAFALILDGGLALALYDYEQAGYKTEGLVTGELGMYVVAPWGEGFAIYVDPLYQGETIEFDHDGTLHTWTITEKGKIQVVNDLS